MKYLAVILLGLNVCFIPRALISQTADEYISKGNQENSSGNYKDAIADYSKALELIPDNAEAYNFRGLSKSNLNHNHGSIADFNKAIELDPNFADAYNNRGISKNVLCL